jgi:hypothetical protein
MDYTIPASAVAVAADDVGDDDDYDDYDDGLCLATRSSLAMNSVKS